MPWPRLFHSFALALLLSASARAQPVPPEELPAPPPAPAEDDAPPADEETAPPAGDEAAPPADDDAAEAAQATPSAASPMYSETMVVTASRTEEALVDAPVSISVVGPAQLATTPADNYADLLRGVPGLNVVQTSARDINFTARSPTSTLATSQLALVDGRSLYQDFFGFVMWDVLPVGFDEVKQVEVQRGPGSAMWGANALTGVINVRTKSPRELDGGLLTLGGGERGTRSAAVRWADAFEKFSYKISTGWFRQDPWPRRNTFADGTPVPSDNDFANEGTEQPKLDTRFDWDLEGGRRWSLKMGRAGTTGLMHTGIGPFQINDNAWEDYTEVSYERPLFEAKVYANRIDGNATNLLNFIEFDFENTTYVADATQHRPVGEKQLWLFGGNVRANRFDLSLAPDESARNEAGFFAEDQVVLGPRLQFNLGVRVDHFDTVGTAVSPRTSVIFKPRPNHSIRVAYNRAYRAPSLINNFLNTIVPNQVQLNPPPAVPFVFLTLARGNAELQEEIVDAFEVGYTAIVRHRTTFTAAIYRNYTKDTIDFHPAKFYDQADPPFGWPPQLPVPERLLVKEYNYRNVGKVVDQGVELSVNRSWDNGYALVGSYTLQDDTRIEEDDPVEPLANQMNRPPTHQASVQLTALRGPWSGAFGMSYVDEAFWTDVLDQRFWGWTDSYLMVSGSLGYRFAKDRMEIVANGTNLTDEPIKMHVFGDEIRRKLTAEVRWRF